MNIREPLVIAEEFNKSVLGLLVKLEKKCRVESSIALIDRTRRRLVMLRGTLPTVVIERAIPSMLKYKDFVLGNNAAARDALIAQLNPRKEYEETYGAKPDPEDEFMFDLTDVIREQYFKLQSAEKETLHQTVVSLFNACVEYKLATGV